MTEQIKGEPPRKTRKIPASYPSAEEAASATGVDINDVFCAKGFCAIRLEKGEFSGRDILNEFASSPALKEFAAVAISTKI